MLVDSVDNTDTHGYSSAKLNENVDTMNPNSNNGRNSVEIGDSNTSMSISSEMNESMEIKNEKSDGKMEEESGLGGSGKTIKSEESVTTSSVPIAEVKNSEASLHSAAPAASASTTTTKNSIIPRVVSSYLVLSYTSDVM
jgi:hypothetical protein